MKKKSYMASFALAASSLVLSQAALFADVSVDGNFQGEAGYIEKGWFFGSDSSFAGSTGATGATGDVGPQGATGARGKRGLKTPVNPLNFDFFVDASQNITTPNGSIAQPFNTISDALVAIQSQVQISGDEVQDVYTILVAGGVYSNEPNNALTISGDGLRVALVALGEVSLGSLESPMPVIWQLGASNSGNAAPLLSLSALSGAGSLFGGKFIIPGGITVTNSASCVLDLSGIIGSISSDSEVPFDLYLNNCQLLGNIQAPNANLQLAEKVVFKAPIQVGSYGSIRACDVQAGMDIGAGWVAGNVQPQGVLLTNCAGNFTSSTASGAILIVDSYTSGSFSAAPGATAAAAVDTTVQMNVVGAAS